MLLSESVACALSPRACWVAAQGTLGEQKLTGMQCDASEGWGSRYKATESFLPYEERFHVWVSAKSVRRESKEPWRKGMKRETCFFKQSDFRKF